MARYDDLNTKGIAYAAVLSIAVLVVVLQGTQALCYYMVNSADAQKEMKKSDSARDAKSEQLASLNGFKRVDVLDESAPAAKKGEEPAMRKAIRIPVEEAQKIILKELSTAPVPTPGT